MAAPNGHEWITAGGLDVGIEPVATGVLYRKREASMIDGCRFGSNSTASSHAEAR